VVAIVVIIVVFLLGILCFVLLPILHVMFLVLDPKDSGLDFRNLLRHKYVYSAEFIIIHHIELFIVLSILSFSLHCVICVSVLSLIGLAA